ncbi:MAG: hypothetical protein KF833_06195 [Verrucomicrobiae bacterium]|nr:hypothetical protein [Verrucomicrobiae bacterium]
MLLILAGVALGILLGERMILDPLTGAWKARSARVADLRKKVTQGQMLLDRERAIRDRWASMRREALPRDVSVAENQLLGAFDRWSRESGVGISAIRPQWRRGPEDSMVIECRADAFGNLSRLTHFLYLLEKDPLPVRIETLELSARDPRGDQLNLSLQISVLMLPTTGS